MEMTVFTRSVGHLDTKPHLQILAFHVEARVVSATTPAVPWERSWSGQRPRNGSRNRLLSLEKCRNEREMGSPTAHRPASSQNLLANGRQGDCRYWQGIQRQRRIKDAQTFWAHSGLDARSWSPVGAYGALFFKFFSGVLVLMHLLL